MARKGPRFRCAKYPACSAWIPRQDNHDRDFHDDQNITVTFNGKIVVIIRNKLTKTFLCPCGDSQHSRSSANAFRLLFKNPEQHPLIIPDQGAGDGNEDDAAMQIPEAIEVPPDELFQPTPDVSVELEPPSPSLDEDDFADEDILLEDQPHSGALRLMLSHALCVNPKYGCIICLDCQAILLLPFVHHHRRDAHTAFYNSHHLPSESTFTSSLRTLGAQNHPVFPIHAISPIYGVEVRKNGAKCGERGCPTSGTVYRDRAACLKHAKSHPVSREMYQMVENVACHQVGMHRGGGVTYVEVDQQPFASGSIISEVLGAKNEGECRSPSGGDVKFANFLAVQCRWDQFIQGNVDLGRCRATTFHPDPRLEPTLHGIYAISQSYYASIVSSMGAGCLPHLVMCYIHSSSTSHRKVTPFEAPAEETIKTDADHMALYICFLYRHMTEPLTGFSVPIHSTLQGDLKSLCDLIRSNAPKELSTQAFHTVVWGMLSLVSDEAQQREDLCHLNLFLLASHLSDSNGSFLPVARVPPNISRLQWCFRATCVQEILAQRLLSQDNPLIIYRRAVQPHLTEGENSNTLFTLLRRLQQTLSGLCQTQPAVSRFIWDPTGTVLSVGGFPIRMSRVVVAANEGMRDLEAEIHQLSGGADIASFLRYVDSRLGTKAEPQPFVDWPRKATPGTSIFTFLINGLHPYRHLVLEHVWNTFFRLIEGIPVPIRGEIQKFLTTLDAIVARAFFLTLLTSGGGPGNMENKDITFANTQSGTRQIFIFRGWLGIYSKSTHKDPIVYTPPLSLARLLLTIWGVLYPTAAVLSAAVMDATMAGNYLSHPYVQSGKIMQEKELTSALNDHTLRRFGTKLGIRDVRGLLRHALDQATGASFFTSDEVGRDELGVDRQMGHSTNVAHAHYAVDEKALPNLSDAEIALHQRVSLRWHLFLGVLPEKYMYLITDEEMTKDYQLLLKMYRTIIPQTKLEVQKAISASTRRNTESLLHLVDMLELCV